MHLLTEFAVSLSLLTIAAAIVCLVREHRRLRSAVERIRVPSLTRDVYGTSIPLTSRRAAGIANGFAIFVYREGVWHLEADLSAPGCEVTAPSIKGTFDGQVVKRDAIVGN
jgi:hypothetical protein